MWPRGIAWQSHNAGENAREPRGEPEPGYRHGGGKLSSADGQREEAAAGRGPRGGGYGRTLGARRRGHDDLGGGINLPTR